MISPSAEQTKETVERIRGTLVRSGAYTAGAFALDDLLTREITDLLASQARALEEAQREKLFPIQAERGARPHPRQVPWSIAELAYSVYSARYGNSQSLERLAERCGFCPSEMDEFLPDWRERCSEIASLKAQLTAAQGEIAEWKACVASCAKALDVAELRAEQAEAERARLLEALTLIASRAAGCQLEPHAGNAPAPELVAVQEIYEWAHEALSTPVRPSEETNENAVLRAMRVSGLEAERLYELVRQASSEDPQG